MAAGRWCRVAILATAICVAGAPCFLGRTASSTPSAKLALAAPWSASLSSVKLRETWPKWRWPWMTFLSSFFTSALIDTRMPSTEICESSFLTPGISARKLAASAITRTLGTQALPDDASAMGDQCGGLAANGVRCLIVIASIACLLSSFPGLDRPNRLPADSEMPELAWYQPFRPFMPGRRPATCIDPMMRRSICPGPP